MIFICQIYLPQKSRISVQWNKQFLGRELHCFGFNLNLRLPAVGNLVCLSNEKSLSKLEKDYGANTCNRKISIAEIEQKLQSLGVLTNEDFTKKFLLFVFVTFLFPISNDRGHSTINREHFLPRIPIAGIDPRHQNQQPLRYDPTKGFIHTCTLTIGSSSIISSSPNVSGDIWFLFNYQFDRREEMERYKNSESSMSKERII